MKFRLLLPFIVCSLFVSGCSTYKTNTDITFKTTKIANLKPVIHVGDIKQTADQLTYLGWVEAEVKKPSAMHMDPTKRQADIVLAYKGKELGADAVIHVTYKQGKDSSFLGKITARGQAVIINHKERDEGMVIEPQIPDIDNILTPQAEKDIIIPKVEEETPVVSSFLNPEVQASIRQGDNSYTSADFYIEEKPSFNEPDFSTLEVEDEVQADIDNIKLMLNNAEFLKEKGDEYKDKDIYNAASRLSQLLKNYLNKLENQK